MFSSFLQKKPSKDYEILKMREALSSVKFQKQRKMIMLRGLLPGPSEHQLQWMVLHVQTNAWSGTFSA